MAGAPPFSPAERRLLLATGCGHFLTHFYMVLLPVVALAVAAEDGGPFRLTPGGSLALTLPAYLLYGLGAVPAGLLCDRWQTRAVLVLCLTGMGGGAAVAALAPAPAALAAAWALLGLSAAAYHPAGLALLSLGVRARGRALGVNGVCGNLGIAAAPFAAALAADALGWRGALLLLGLLGLLGAAVTAVILRDSETQQRPPPLPPPEPGARYGLYLALLGGVLVLGGLAYRAALTAAPELFVERVTLLRPAVEALLRRLGATAWEGRLTPGSLMLSLAVLLGCTGQLLGGALADRRDLRLLYLVFYAAALPAALLCARLAELGLVFGMAAYVFFTLGMQPIENSLISRLTPARWRSTAFGLKFVLTFGVGSLGVRLTAAVLDDTGSAGPVFHYVAGLTAGLVLLIALLYATSCKAVPRLLQRRPGEGLS